jgi:hypothetical protein
MSVPELLAALTLAIDHKSVTPPFVTIPGTASAGDQFPIPGMIKNLTSADQANTLALAAITTAQSSGPTIAAAHAAWASSLAAARAAQTRATRAAAVVPSPTATQALRQCTSTYQGLLASEPPVDSAAAVAAATTKQQAAQAVLTEQMTQAQSYLDYLAVA